MDIDAGADDGDEREAEEGEEEDAGGDENGFDPNILAGEEQLQQQPHKRAAKCALALADCWVDRQHMVYWQAQSSLPLHCLCAQALPSAWKLLTLTNSCRGRLRKQLKRLYDGQQQQPAQSMGEEPDEDDIPEAITFGGGSGLQQPQGKAPYAHASGLGAPTQEDAGALLLSLFPLLHALAARRRCLCYHQQLLY